MALERVEDFADRGRPPDQAFIQELHGIVIVRLRGRRAPSRYRQVECPVVDSATRGIDYAPPKPADVPSLMAALEAWLHASTTAAIPVPMRAAILSHRFLTIHPFEDGNGRTARLLATTELWRSGYRMRGFFSFEEFFAADRAKYYRSLQMGLHFDFYEGRHDAELTEWIEYCVETMATAADELRKRAQRLHQMSEPPAMPWEELPRRQQQVLTRLLLASVEQQTALIELRPADIRDWFEVSAATARKWLHEWVDAGFVEPEDTANQQRVRRFSLAARWRTLVEEAVIEVQERRS